MYRSLSVIDSFYHDGFKNIYYLSRETTRECSYSSQKLSNEASFIYSLDYQASKIRQRQALSAKYKSFVSNDGFIERLKLLQQPI